MNPKITITTLSIATSLSTHALASTILIDFGSDTSFRGVSVASPVDTNGNAWNSVVPGALSLNLLDTTGSATSVDLGFLTGIGTDSFNGPAGATSNPPSASDLTDAAASVNEAALGILGIAEAFIDYGNSVNGGPARFSLLELDPGKTYDLTIFASRQFNDDATTIYNVYSDNTFTELLATTSLNVHQPGSSFLENTDQLATLSNLDPGSNNALYVEFIGSANNAGFINAFSLVGTDVPPPVIPEPASAALLGLGGLILARRRHN